MPEQHEKRCQRCGSDLSCKPSSIHECQCMAVKLSDGQRRQLAERFTNCLCVACLTEESEQLEG
ncbi:MAG: cysteine-rich CWC family protein [Flavobacteriales bacterium]|nr:cysteine-rich CWC family protein [Flavobacteriales bacterium]